MNRTERLWAGVVICLAIGCATANQAVKKLTPEQRIELELTAARLACSELPPEAGSTEVRKLCALLTAE